MKSKLARILVYALALLLLSVAMDLVFGLDKVIVAILKILGLRQDAYGYVRWAKKKNSFLFEKTENYLLEKYRKALTLK